MSEECPFRCKCEDTVLTRRVIANGVVNVYRQCRRCGSGSAVPKRSAPDPDTLPPWDASISDRWWEMRNEWYESQRAAEAAEWRQRYDAHMKSMKWWEIRGRVMKRCGGVCEGCGLRPANQAHHLTYEHLGDELLYELVGLCLDCHEKAHARRLQPRIIVGEASR